MRREFCKHQPGLAAVHPLGRGDVVVYLVVCDGGASARRFFLRKGRRGNQSDYWGLGRASPDVRLVTRSYREGGTSGITVVVTMVTRYFLVLREK